MSQSSPPRSFKEMDLSLFDANHVARYQATGGEEGYIWNTAPILLLTTRGRKSGEPRIHPLIFVENGGNPAIIASKGGAPTNPAWYENLSADSNVTVQVKADVFQAVARVVDGAERERIWAEGVKLWPQYEDYQRATERQIPVVVLERT